MKDPERRDQLWLRLYPKSYRTARGGEILSTLLDATDRDRPSPRDLLSIVPHAVKVRVSLIAKGPRRRPLPQPVRLVTWILVGMAASSWVNAILDHGYPKSPGPHPQPSLIVTGFIFLGLNFLLQARRRMLFLLVIGVFVLFITSTVIDTRPAYAGLILTSPYVLFVLLLLGGWKRYMTAIAHDGLRSRFSDDLTPTAD
jgi:hypothetical protein